MITEQAGLHDPRVCMDEASRRIGSCERFRCEGVHGAGMGCAVAKGVVRFEREVVKVEFSFCAGCKDGNNARKGAGKGGEVKLGE